MEPNSIGSELIALLESIAKGETIVSTAQDPQVVFTGELAFWTGTGWKLRIDLDCNAYGGFAEVVTPGDRRLGREELEALDDDLDRVFTTCPQLEWEGFGLGGYHDTRCRQCGASRLRGGSSEGFCVAGACRLLRMPPCPSRVRLSAA